ncbi:MAG: ABC transporter ATP-binding protein [Phycisphaerae bacterium]|nr:ABC transporter ATP-binding protein [Phycisphaerae bacterium]
MTEDTTNFPPTCAKPDDGVVIRLQGVSKSFGPTAVFEDVCLEIHRGETTVVIGASGVGKSVLLKIIIGIIKPDRGRVFVDGTDITDKSERDLEPIRMQFGMVFQGAALFDSLTVEENVGFLLYEHSRFPKARIRQIVAEKLAMVDLSGTEDLRPEELSGGMKKRVGLARAIAMNPKVILYDEPTTGLDPVTADVINHLIIKTQEELEATSIVVTHDMQSAYKVGDRIVMLYHGNIIADAAPEEIRNHTDPRVQSFIHGEAHLAPHATDQGGVL